MVCRAQAFVALVVWMLTVYALFCDMSTAKVNIAITMSK